MSYESIIYRAAVSQGFPGSLANLIVAQAKHESANFTSNVFRQNNNPFGYKYVGQSLATRGTPAPASEGGNYARYVDVSYATLEIVKWIQRRQNETKFPRDLSTITTPKQYAQLLKNAGYYGASVTEYAAGLARWISDSSAGFGVAGILVALLVFFLVKK